MNIHPQASLKLTKSEPELQDPYLLERRSLRRRKLDGRVTSVYKEMTPEGPRNCICSLRLLDISDSGLGAISQEPLPLNCSIALFFPPHGAERGFDLYGKVVRSRLSSVGHEIGIELKQRQAA